MVVPTVSTSYLSEPNVAGQTRTELLMIEYLVILVLVNGEVATAMGRALLGNSSSNVTQPALISPVSPRSARGNHALVGAIVVLMVLATVALFCCCYLWERQLRLRIGATRSSTQSLQGPGGSTHSSGPQMGSSAQMGSSPSVIVLLGDDIARSVAWAVPQRISASAASEAAIQPTATNADQSRQKLAPK